MSVAYVHTMLTGRYLYQLGDHDPSQPHLAMLAWEVVDDEDHDRVSKVTLIEPRPEWEFSDETASMNGFTREDCRGAGWPLENVLRDFVDSVHEVDEIWAFNSDHHMRALRRAAFEAGNAYVLPLPEKDRWRCAMRLAAPVIRKPRMQPGGGWMWPKQGEAYSYFSNGQELPKVDTKEGWSSRCLALVDSVRIIAEGIKTYSD